MNQERILKFVLPTSSANENSFTMPAAASAFPLQLQANAEAASIYHDEDDASEVKAWSPEKKTEKIACFFWGDDYATRILQMNVEHSWNPTIVRQVVRLTHFEIDEVIGLTLQEVTRKITSEGYVTFAFLRMTLASRAIDYLRKKKIKCIDTSSYVDDTIDAEECGRNGSSVDFTKQADLHQLIREVMESLDNENRSLILRLANGESVESIARQLGITYKAAESKFSRARKILNAALFKVVNVSPDAGYKIKAKVLYILIRAAYA